MTVRDFGQLIFYIFMVLIMIGFAYDTWRRR